MPTLIGLDIGRYHIIEQLGEGGMATVYKAFDTRLERQVAIKFIRHEIIPPERLEQTLKRFEREAKALARFSHPNIVKVYDFGEHEGSPFLVMEYLQGGTLRSKIGQPLPYSEAARMLLPVARALDYAHHRNVVHRDIKPANILVTEDGEPMLSDFGIAKILEADDASALTGTGVGIGTPEYMAPEQGIGKQVDHRADIYALGIVFYELVTGRKPYQADTPMAVVLKHIRDTLPRPKDFVPGLPDEVERVIFKALAKNPDERYQKMGEFIAALEKFSTGEALSVTDSRIDETLTLTDQPGTATPASQPEPLNARAPSGVSFGVEQTGSRSQSAAPISQPVSRPGFTATGSPASGVLARDADMLRPSAPVSVRKVTQHGKPPLWLWILLSIVALGVVGVIILLGSLGVLYNIGSRAIELETKTALVAQKEMTQAPSEIPILIPNGILTPTVMVTPTVHQNPTQVSYVSLFAGLWDTNWGDMTCSVDGQMVNCNYTHDKGKIEATLGLDGMTMEGGWSEAPSYAPPADGGKVTFSISEDGNTITGHWWYGQNKDGGSWTGTRK